MLYHYLYFFIPISDLFIQHSDNLFLKNMNIPIKVQLDVNLYNISRIVILGCAIFAISLFSMFHLETIETSRGSFTRRLLPNVTESVIRSYCKTPYDDSRCSVQPANRNDSKHCLTDLEAMTGHILPLVSFVMQISLTQELFALSGNYSHILRNILWLITLFIFTVIAVAVHGSACYHLYGTFIVFLTGSSLGSFVIILVARGGKSCCPVKTPHNTEL